MEYDDEQDDTDEDVTDKWERITSNLHGYPRLSDKRSDGEGLSGSAYQLPRHYNTSSELPGPPSVKMQPKESVSSLLFYSSYQMDGFPTM